MNNKTTISVIGILVIITIGVIYLITRERPSDDRLPLRIGYIQTLSGLPLYVALEDNFFDEAGFLVESIQFRSSDLAFKSLETGEIDLIGVAGMTQALQLSRDQPEALNILGVLYSTTALIGGSKEASPSSIQELDGATIGSFPGSVFETYTRKALAAEGVDISTLTIIPLPPPLQLQSLEEGRIQALYTLEPTGIMAGERGVGRYLTEEDLFSKHFLDGKPFPGGAVAISKKYASAHPESSREVIEIYQRALDKITPTFNATPYLERHTSISADYISLVKFEGGAFGDNIDRPALDSLVNKLILWELLPDEFSLNNAFKY